MALEDVISLSITLQSSAVSMPGFGTPMILSPAAEAPAGFSDRFRYFTSAADLLSLGYDTGDQTYKEAVALMSQNPRPERFGVGRRLAAVAQVHTFTLPSGAQADGDYTITLNGTAHTVSAVSQTGAQIATSLIALIQAGAQASVLTATTGGAGIVSVTSDTAGLAFSSSAVSPGSVIVRVATTANVGIAEDLAAISAEETDWYMLVATFRDETSIMETAAAIEGMTQKRMFMAQSSDADILSTSYTANVTTDVASRLRDAGYDRTALVYHSVDAECLASAWVGQCIGPVPASLTWAFKELAGVTSNSLTTDQRYNLVSKNGNSYEPVAGRKMTFDGKAASGDWIDITRGVDKLYSRIQALVFGGFISVPKIPYTQGGIETVASNVRAALDESMREGLIAPSRVISGKTYAPGYTITTPDIGDIVASDRETRLIPASNPIRFEGTLQGAIHKANIVGTLSF